MAPKRQRKLAPRKPAKGRPDGQSNEPTASSPAPAEPLPRDPALDSDEEEDCERASQSPIWKHFIRLKASKRHPHGAIRCRACTEKKAGKQHLSLSGTSTGHLYSHLRTQHKALFDNLRPEESCTPTHQPGIKSAVRHRNRAFTKERFWQLVLRWMVMSSVAFNEVENKYLQEAFYFCHEEAHLPSPDTVRRHISDTYHEMLPRVRAMLQSTPGQLSFTTDEWTSPNIIAFKSITVHFIDSEWRLRNLQLGFEPLEGSHDHVKLHEVFTGVLSEWGISYERIGSITYDNHKVNDAFMKRLATVNGLVHGQGYRCLAHVINLAAPAFMECQLCDAVAEKVRAIARHVLRSGSAQRMEQWREVCGKVLQLDMKVRWSSTHDMLRDAVKMKEKI